MSTRGLQRRQLLKLLISSPALYLLGSRSQSLAMPLARANAGPGDWVYLSDLEWSDATTGWLGVANEYLPALDHAFHGPVLTLAGVGYDKGIGTYPLSEITYDLGGTYETFTSEIGLDATADGSEALVRFLVYVDGDLRYESHYMPPGDPPQHLDVALAGARTLRLVADSDLGHTKGGYADWADARLLRSQGSAGPQASVTPSPPPRPAPAASPTPRQTDEQALLDQGRRMVAALPTGVRRVRAATERPGSYFDRRGNRLWLSTGRVAAGFSLDAATYGALTLLDMEALRPVILDAGSGLVLDKTYHLATDAQADGTPPFASRPVDDPVAGSGMQAELKAVTKDGRWHTVLRLSLFANGIMLYDMSVSDPISSDLSPVFEHISFDSEKATLLLENDAEYLTDFSRLRTGRFHDDDLIRREAVGEGKPLFIWSTQRQRGLLMAMVDDTRGPTYFAAQVPRDHAQARWGLRSGPTSDAQSGNGARSSRLYMEITRTADVRHALDNLRVLLDGLAPEAPLPEWMKYQWLSWYTYSMGNDAEATQKQADYIATNLADLGPWHVLIDAGWYVSEGRPTADWRTVDEAKFPGGLRPLVDRLHDQGLCVVLYLSVPYVDSVVAAGHWLGMRQIIDEHQDWLLPLGSDGERTSYVFDFKNPAVLDYWSQVMDDFFVVYGVDGIKIDGLGNVEGALISPENIDSFGLVSKVNEQTMDIYTFFYEEATRRRADAYVETGWLTPTFARSYAHAFRYGDERPLFRSVYPTPGMVEHIDYAVVQKQVLNLRPNMGALYDEFHNAQVCAWWLEAALALGSHVTLGFDLTGMSRATLSLYRSLLAHYDPFTGVTTYGPGMRPQTFATTRDGTTYLGVLNRSRQARQVTVPLADHGLTPGRPATTAYDVENRTARRLRDPFVVDMPAESFRLYIIRRDPGVLWTNSSFEVQADSRSLEAALTGPDGLPGTASVLVPRPRLVRWDDILLAEGSSSTPGQYSFDRAASILSVQYDNDSAGHILRVSW